MKYLLHPEAEAEFVQAIEYYEDCEEGRAMTLRLRSIPLLNGQHLIQKRGPSLSKT